MGHRNFPAVSARGNRDRSDFKAAESYSAALLQPQKHLPEGMYWHPITVSSTQAALIKRHLFELFNIFSLTANNITVST